VFGPGAVIAADADDRDAPAGVAPLVEGTQRLQALGAVGSEPLADLPFGDTEEVGHLVLGPALRDREDSGEPPSDAFVVGLATTAFGRQPFRRYL
jgi:hypothetical protein